MRTLSIAFRKAGKFLLDIVEIYVPISAFISLFILFVVQVFFRYFLNRPQVWVTEVIECLLLYITFLGSAWLLREEGHIKVDVLVNRVGRRTGAVFGIIGSIIGLFVSFTLTVYGFRLTWDYFLRGIYTPTALEIPVSAIIIIIPVGSFALLLEFVRRTLTFVAGFIIEMRKPSP